MSLTQKEINQISSLKYVPPTEQNKVKFEKVTYAAEQFMRAIIEHCPDCADRTHALRLVRDTRMWANAAISLEGMI